MYHRIFRKCNTIRNGAVRKGNTSLTWELYKSPYKFRDKTNWLLWNFSQVLVGLSMITRFGVHLIPHCWNRKNLWVSLHATERDTVELVVTPVQTKKTICFASYAFSNHPFPLWNGLFHNINFSGAVCDWHRHLVPWCHCGLCSLKPNMFFEHSVRNTHRKSNSPVSCVTTFMSLLAEVDIFSQKTHHMMDWWRPLTGTP